MLTLAQPVLINGLGQVTGPDRHWQGAVPNSDYRCCKLPRHGDWSCHCRCTSQTVNQIVFNAATPSYTIGGSSVLSVAGITPSSPTRLVAIPPHAPFEFSQRTAINVTAGTLAISPTTANTVGTGVNATVAASATLPWV